MIKNRIAKLKMKQNTNKIRTQNHPKTTNLHKIMVDKLIHLTCGYFFIGKPKQMNQLKLVYPLNKHNLFYFNKFLLCSYCYI
jgi:hypothetical protein